MGFCLLFYCQTCSDGNKDELNNAVDYQLWPLHALAPGVPANTRLCVRRPGFALWLDFSRELGYTGLRVYAG